MNVVPCVVGETAVVNFEKLGTPAVLTPSTKDMS